MLLKTAQKLLNIFATSLKIIPKNYQKLDIPAHGP